MHALRPKIPAWYRESVFDDSLRGQLLPRVPYRKLMRIRRRFWLAIAVYIGVMMIAFPPSVLALASFADRFSTPKSNAVSFAISALVILTFLFPILLIALLYNIRRRLQTMRGRCLNCGEIRQSDFLEVCSNCGDSHAEQDGYRRVIDARFAIAPPAYCQTKALTRTTSLTRNLRRIVVAFAIIGVGLIAAILVRAWGLRTADQQFLHRPPDQVEAILFFSAVFAILAAGVTRLVARHRNGRANLDRLAGRCFKCESPVDPNDDDCPHCGSWLPLQRLYNEYLQVRVFKRHRPASRSPEAV